MNLLPSAIALGLFSVGITPPSVPPPASQPAAPPESHFLRGPTVPDSASTLVTTDARGSFVALDVRPEEAALGLLRLDPERRELAQEAAAKRRHAIGMLLVDRIDVVKEATDAQRAGETDRVRALYRDLHDELNPGSARDLLMPVYAEFLTDPEREEMMALVEDYWSAWIDWELRAVPEPTDALRQETQDRLLLQLFQRELGEAYRWSLQPFRARLDALYAVTEPTPEQRSALREVVIDHIRDARLDPTPEQRRDVANRIYAILDEEQRMRLFELAVWER